MRLILNRCPRSSISAMYVWLLHKRTAKVLTLLIIALFFPFDSSTEARVVVFFQEDQQHLQHRGNHLQHERSQRSRTDNHLQERHIHSIAADPRGPRDPTAQNGWWIRAGGSEKVIQSCQQSGQDLSYHLSSALLHLQPGVLGHLRQQKADHQQVQPTEMNTATAKREKTASPFSISNMMLLLLCSFSNFHHLFFFCAIQPCRCRILVSSSPDFYVTFPVLHEYENQYHRSCMDDHYLATKPTPAEENASHHWLPVAMASSHVCY